MRGWALPLLRCVACGADPLHSHGDRIRCGACGAVYAVEGDIADFTLGLNAVPARERLAVKALDKVPEDAVRLGALLRKWDGAGLSEAEIGEYACLRHAIDARQQILEVLRSRPLKPGAMVLEIGADQCWASNVFLDRGCRVIACDITDHLQLAPRATDPDLCRIYADMNRLPVGDNRVDVVWATSAAHHSWDLGATFREAARVLKPGGRLYFCCEPIPSWWRHLFGRDFGHWERELGINETWLPRRRWLKLSAAAGLEPELFFPLMDRRTIGSRLRQRHLPEWPSLLLRPFLRKLQVSIHLLAVKAHP